MYNFKFFGLATGLVCLCLIGQMMPVVGNQRVVRKLTLQPGLVANVSVGYPEQYFNLLFNTASPDTWLVAIGCASRFRMSSNRYRSNDSLTYLEDGQLWVKSLAIGAVIEGHLSKDTFGLAEAFVADQVFAEVVDSEGWIANHFAFDGVLGLSSPRPFKDEVMDPIQNMHRQRLIPRQIFSLHVSKNDQDDWVGTAVLGRIDEQYFKGQITYVPIINRWTFLLDGLELPNKKDEQFNKSKVSIDSTTNIILAPKSIVEAVKILFGAHDEPRTEMARWNSCSDVPDETAITLVISGTNMTLSAEDLVIKLAHKGETICYLAMQSHPEDIWVLGTPFLRKYYTIFDYDHKRVGFAASV